MFACALLSLGGWYDVGLDMVVTFGFAGGIGVWVRHVFRVCRLVLSLLGPI